MHQTAGDGPIAKAQSGGQRLQQLHLLPATTSRSRASFTKVQMLPDRQS
jgi:hypothetical protein